MQNIPLPVVLYESESSSVTLRKGHGLRVFENGVLKIRGYLDFHRAGSNRRLEKTA
jgi:hypothetical protein